MSKGTFLKKKFNRSVSTFVRSKVTVRDVSFATKDSSWRELALQLGLVLWFKARDVRDWRELEPILNHVELSPF